MRGGILCRGDCPFRDCPHVLVRGQSLKGQSPRNGFTLVELMVSLFIFGLLAAAGVSLLAFSVRAQESAKVRLADAGATARISALLTGDLLQAVPRLTRNTRGDREPVFRGGEGSLVLAYVRGGWANAEGAGRSGLQRVELQLNDGRLERVVRPLVDGAAPLPPVVLAEGIGNARLRFRVKGEWLDRWQPSNVQAMPQAVELTITRAGEAPLTRLFLVGVGG